MLPHDWQGRQSWQLLRHRCRCCQSPQLLQLQADHRLHPQLQAALGLQVCQQQQVCQASGCRLQSGAVGPHGILLPAALCPRDSVVHFQAALLAPLLLLGDPVQTPHLQ